MPCIFIGCGQLDSHDGRCTLVFVRGKSVAYVCGTRTCGTCMYARHDLCNVKMKCKEKNGTLHLYCPYAFACNQCISI